MAKPDTAIIASMSSHSLIEPAGDRAGGGRPDWPGNRFEKPQPLPVCALEEVLVVDDRATLRPAQVVESKLARLLQEASLPVSHLQMRGLLRAR